MRAPAARSSGAAGVPQDNQRAQTCTFERPGLQKHHQNSTRRPPRGRRKKEISGEREKQTHHTYINNRLQQAPTGHPPGTHQAPTRHPTTPGTDQAPTRHPTRAPTNNRIRIFLAKCGLGQMRFGQLCDRDKRVALTFFGDPCPCVVGADRLWPNCF